MIKLPLFDKIRDSKYRSPILLAIITAIYLLLVSNKFFFLVPQGGYDDALQFRLAKSLSSGQWLGPYDGLTLAKGITYPLWLAGLHILDIPLWLGNELLYILAGLLFIYAIRPLVIKKEFLAGIYALILFNPLISPRAYRDSIAPSLCLITLAWIIGMYVSIFAKRTKMVSQKLLTVAGVFGLTAWWYLREDYFWILPFVLTGVFVILGYSIFRFWKAKIKLIKLGPLAAYLALPFIVVLLAGGIISSLNYHHYGRFVVNDYTSADFRGAYGALTRIKDDNWRPIVPVSSSMRQKAYAASPAFKELQTCLDNNDNPGCDSFRRNKRAPGDYEGGWFFWAIRVAVAQKGYYKDAATAEQYYKRLANEINTACDNHTLDCAHGPRSSLAPAPDSREIDPVIDDIPKSTNYLLLLKEADAENLTTIKLDPATPARDEMANYMEVRYRADQLNFGAKAKRKIEIYLAKLYKLVNPILFIAALITLIWQTIKYPKTRKQGPKLLLGWGLLALLSLRVVMLAYVTATSFPAINTLYFGSAYVVMFAFEGLVLAGGIKPNLEKSGSSKSTSRGKNQS